MAAVRSKRSKRCCVEERKEREDAGELLGVKYPLAQPSGLQLCPNVGKYVVLMAIIRHPIFCGPEFRLG